MAHDPVRLELVKNAIGSVVDEMVLTVIRIAYSSIMKDTMDLSSAFCDRQGRMIAQGLSVALHLGSIPDAMDSVIAKYGDTLAPGDIVILNDPYLGGMHLPDIFMFKPVFVGERLLGYAVVVAHHNDMGGRVPGSSAADSTEIFQEGLRIPILKLYERGEPNQTLLGHDRAQRPDSRRGARRPAGAGRGVPDRRARHRRARGALRRGRARALLRRSPRLQRARGPAHRALDPARHLSLRRLPRRRRRQHGRAGQDRGGDPRRRRRADGGPRRAPRRRCGARSIRRCRSRSRRCTSPCARSWIRMRRTIPASFARSTSRRRSAAS